MHPIGRMFVLSEKGLDMTEPVKQLNEAAARTRSMLDVRAVGARIGRGPSWIWEAVRRGDLPKPIRCSARCTRWDSLAIDRWIDQQFDGRSQ